MRANSLELCYVMLCYVMLCYVTLRYVTLCYVMLCYVMFRILLMLLITQLKRYTNALPKTRAQFSQLCYVSCFMRVLHNEELNDLYC
jgi:uncharacterized sodium:solute symporter family permease YidK